MSMTKQEYIAFHQNAVRLTVMFYQAIKDYPLSEILDRINRAESVGAILDPTLYRAKQDALAEDKEMITMLFDFQNKMAKFAQRYPMKPEGD